MEIKYCIFFLLAIVANLSIVLFHNARILRFPSLFFKTFPVYSHLFIKVTAGCFLLLFLVFNVCHFGSAKLSDFWK